MEKTGLETFWQREFRAVPKAWTQMNICTSDHPPQPRQNTVSLGNRVSKDVDAKISTNALVKYEEVECPFFIHSKQKLTLHFLSTPPTVLTGYSHPTDGKEAKPAPRMTSRLRQFLHGPRLLSSIFRDLSRALNGDHSNENVPLSPLLYFITAWLLFSCKMKCQHAIPFSTRELQPYWTENPRSLGFPQFPL